MKARGGGEVLSTASLSNTYRKHTTTIKGSTNENIRRKNKSDIRV